MKSPLRPVFPASRRLLALLALVATSAFIPTAARATIYYWDTNAAAGFTSVTGSWDGTNTFWNTDSTGATTGTFVASPTSADDLNISSGTAGTLTITGTGTGSSLTFSDNVANIVTGGTLALGGTGTSSGLFITSAVTAATTVSSALTLNNTAVTFQNAGTGVLTVSGGVTGAQNLTLNNNGATASGITISTGSLNNTGSVTNSGTGAGSVLISAAVGANVTGITQNSSTSSLTLSGTNTGYAGTTTLQAGTLVLSTATALGGNGSTTGTGGSFVVNGGNLNGGATTTFTTKNAVSLNNNFSYNGSSLTFDAGSAVTLGNSIGVGFTTGNTLTFNGSVGGSGLSLTKYSLYNNTGNLVLNGSANSYTGGTNIFNGTVTMASVPATGAIFIRDAAPTTPGIGASILALSFNPSQPVADTLIGNIASNSTGVLALSTGISSNLSFATKGNLSLGATAASTYSGTLTPYNQTYQLGGGGSTLTVSSALADVNGTATNLIMDPAVAGSSPGNVTLTGANTYTGFTRVNTGTMLLDFSLATPASNIVSSSSGLFLNNGATLQLKGKSATTNSQTFNGTTLLGGANNLTLTSNSATSLAANLGDITRTNHSTLSIPNVPTATVQANSTTGSTSNGIIPWITTGTTTSARFATGSGSTLTSYSAGTAAADPSGLGDTSGTVNYDLAAGSATGLTGSFSNNSIRYTGAAGTIDIGTVASNSNTLTTNAILNAGTGTLTIQDSGTTPSGGLVVGGSNELVLNTAGSAITISANISGASGAVTVTGPNTVTLSGANTFGGGVTLNQGTLTVGNAAALGTGTLTLSGGKLINTAAFTLANGIYVTPGTVSTIGAQAAGQLTLTGALTGSGTVFSGDGTTQNSALNLNGDNSAFTGTLIFNSNGGNGAQLSIAGATAAGNNLSQATVIGISNGTRRFSVSTGTLQLGSFGGFMQLIGSGTYQFGALNTDTTWSGTGAGGSAPIFVKVGSGTFTLNGAGNITTGTGSMTFTTTAGSGGIIVNGGTFVDDLSNINSGVNQLAGTTPLTLQGGTFKVLEKAGTAGSQAIASTTINPGASSIVVSQNGGSSGVVATLAGITRTTTVGTAGGGTVDFVLPTGTQSSTNGITTTSTSNVLGGIMTQAGTNSIAYATVNQTDWAALSGNNIVALSSYTTGSLANNADVTTSFTGADAAAPTSLRFNTDGQTLTLGTGTQVVTGGILVTANSSSAGSTITGNTLTTGGGREFVFIDYGKLTVASQLVNNAGGSTLLTKSGTGTLFLTNTNNTYSGINYLNAGVVNIAAAASLGASTAANAISFNGGTLQLAGSFNLNSTQGINLGFNGGTFDTNGFASTYAGAIASSAAVMGTTSENTAGQFGFTKAGAGTLTLTGTNTYAGATTITGGKLSVSYLDNATTAGNVTPASAGGIGKSSNYAKNLVLNGGTLQYTGATAGTDRLFTLGDNGGGLEASGSGAISFTNTGAVAYQINSTGAATNSSPVLTLGGTNTGANTLAASIGNNGLGTTSLTKGDTGTWVLSGANTYTGTTTVTAGTLALGANNVFGATNFALGGGTLAIGTFNNSKVGTLSLTANSAITLGAGGVFAFADSSALNWGSNTLSITGTFVDGASIRFGTSSAGLTSGQLALITINGAAATIDTSGFLVSAIPEPATYAALAGLAGLGLAVWRRRRSA